MASSSGSDTDTTRPFNCDICKLEGVVVSAEGYCTDCLEYLCDNCFKTHRRPKSSRGHKLVGKDKMPARQISDEVVYGKCECNNENNDVYFFCETHKKLLCGHCITNTHNKCVCKTLSKSSQNIETSKEYIDFRKELDEYEESFKMKKNLSYQYKEQCNDSFKQVFKDIDFLKQLLEEKKKAVETLEKEAKKIKDDYERNMQKIEKANGSAVSEVRLTRDDLTALCNMDQCQKLFVGLHRSKLFIRQLHEKMNEINCNIIQQSYAFVSDNVLKNMLTNISDIGELTRVEQDNYSRDIDVSSNEDYPEYGLPKCIALSENSIVVIDYIHNTVQNVKDRSTVNRLSLSSGPWDIAKVSSTRVVVSQPSEEKASFINLENKICHIDKEINVNCRCEGLAYANDKLFIASSKPACIVVYNTKQSKEETRISTDENHCSLFKQPAYIDVSSQKHLICMSDRKSNKVFVFNWTGALLNVFECDEMKMPLKVAFRNETVVVIGFESNTIHIISFERKEENTIKTMYLNNVAIEKVFKDSTFQMNACWQFCAGKYFTLVCKESHL